MNINKTYFFAMLNKSIGCVGAVIALIIIEVAFTYMAFKINTKAKGFCNWMSVIGRFIILALIILGIFLLFRSTFNTLYTSKSLSILFGIFTFGIANVIFDIPSWRDDYEKYTLSPFGKRVKYVSQLSILAFTVGISVWQRITPFHSTPFEKYLSLLLWIALFGALPIILIMLCMDVLIKIETIFNKLYTKDRKTYIVHLNGRKKKHKW